MTEQYYNERAAMFARDTLDLDMGPFYAPFLERIPTGGHILDAGCGPGRDSRAFLARGYEVTACDAAAAMVAMASALIGRPVLHLRFQELAFTETFDGIWACASLLHVPRAEMDDVLGRLAQGLVPGGILFASFKYGAGEGFRNGRHFTDYTEAIWTDQIARQPALEPVAMWTVSDVRPGRAVEQWLNVLVQRPTR
jgi:SAM-dependent methyltransferase